MTEKKTIRADELEAKIKSIIIETLKPKNTENETYTLDTLPMSASFAALGASSLDLIDLIAEFDEAFNTSIPDKEAENILTTQQAVESIGALLKKENRLV